MKTIELKYRSEHQFLHVILVKYKFNVLNIED